MRVLIGTPTYGSGFQPQMAQSVANTMLALAKAGHTVAWTYYPSPFVDVARTELIEEAIQGEADGLLFWDDDVALVGRLGEVARLFNHACATAAVRNRHVPEYCALFRGDPDSTYCVRIRHEEVLAAKDVFSVTACGGALLWVSRNVLDTLKTSGSWPWFKVTMTRADGKIAVQGEDIFFTQLVRKLGFDIVCDPGIATEHIGRVSFVHSKGD